MDSNLTTKQKIYLGAGTAVALAILIGSIFYGRGAKKAIKVKPESEDKGSISIPKNEEELLTPEDEERKHAQAIKLKEEGNAAFKAQNFEKAIQLYGQALALSSKDSHFLYSNRSAAHLAANNLTDAINDAKRSIAVSPNWSKGYFRLGKALLKLNDLTQAHFALKNGLKVDPLSDEIKNELKKVIELLPPFGELDSRSKVENNLVNMYFMMGSKNIAETLSLDYDQVSKLVNEHKDSNLLEQPLIKSSFQTYPVLTLRVLITILINTEDFEIALDLAENALKITPDDPDILLLSLYLRSKISESDINKTFILAKKSLKANPNDILSATLYAHVVMRIHMKITTGLFPSPIYEALEEFERALRIPGTNKIMIVEAGLQTWLKLLQDPQIMYKLQQEEAASTSLNQAYLNGLLRGVFHDLCLNPFFLSALSQVTLFNQIERILTPIRSALATLKPGAEFETLQQLVCVIGIQCWRNGYAWSFLDSDDENNFNINHKKLINMLKPVEGEETTETTVLDPKIVHYAALISMYEPLWKIDNFYSTISKSNLSTLNPLLKQLLKMTVLDHFTEEEIKKNLKALTPIGDSPISLFYKNTVTPKWDNLPANLIKINPQKELDWIFPNQQLKLQNTNAPVKILVAGCGSGTEPCQLATVFEDVEISAFDCSPSQLAFAVRTTKELGLDNKIKYYLADAMILKPSEDLPGNFDLVYANNFLHHLPDLLKGWERLLPFLRPGGLIKVALFPKRWFNTISSVRKFLASKISPPLFENLNDPNKLPTMTRKPSADELREARNLMLESQDEMFADIIHSPTFFNLDDFYEVVFNPQIWALTFTSIGQCLTKLGLNFVGFEFPGISQETILNYRYEHPDDPNMKNFAYLDKFGDENPHSLHIFSNQIILTCEKPLI